MGVHGLQPLLKLTTDLHALIIEEGCRPGVECTITSDLNGSSSERNFDDSQVRCWKCGGFAEQVYIFVITITQPSWEGDLDHKHIGLDALTDSANKL